MKQSDPGADFATEVAGGERYEFGRNWQRYARVVDEARVEEAVAAQRKMLRVERLEGRAFLDIGSGSGIHSLAARRLGARVHSFDYDPSSVACTQALRERFAPGDTGWTVERGSALDRDYLTSLGRFDVVYSWGVLHHTGEMWRALDETTRCVAERGQLFIAIYNDQGFLSEQWRRVKRLYCSGPLGRAAVSSVFIPGYVAQNLLVDLYHLDNPLRRYLGGAGRGMSYVYDWFDWLGGYPFEVARPEEIFEFFRDRGFTLEQIVTTPASGCNQFVFRAR